LFVLHYGFATAIVIVGFAAPIPHYQDTSLCFLQQ